MEKIVRLRNLKKSTIDNFTKDIHALEFDYHSDFIWKQSLLKINDWRDLVLHLQEEIKIEEKKLKLEEENKVDVPF